MTDPIDPQLDGAAGASDESPLASGSNLDQIMPVVLFFVLFNVAGIIPAVLASTAWSLKAAWSRHQRGIGIGWWIPTVAIYLLVRAAITLAAEREWVDFGVSSEAVYFGIGFATKFLIGFAVAGTILVGKPVLAWAIPKVVSLPAAVLDDPRYHRVMANATWLIVVYEIGSAVWDIWLYNNSGFNVFFLARGGVNFVISFALIMVGLLYIDRGLEPIEEYPGMTELLEAQTGGRS